MAKEGSLTPSHVSWGTGRGTGWVLTSALLRALSEALNWKSIGNSKRTVPGGGGGGTKRKLVYSFKRAAETKSKTMRSTLKSSEQKRAR